MPTTCYFDEQVLRTRPYLTLEICEAVVADPSNARRRTMAASAHWGAATLPNHEGERILHVIPSRTA